MRLRSRVVQNITDAATAGRRDLTLDVNGYARVTERGRFSIDLDRDMTASADRVWEVSSTGGEAIAASSSQRSSHQRARASHRDR
jgi:hypothetical protein